MNATLCKYCPSNDNHHLRSNSGDEPRIPTNVTNGVTTVAYTYSPCDTDVNTQRAEHRQYACVACTQRNANYSVAMGVCIAGQKLKESVSGFSPVHDISDDICVFLFSGSTISITT